MSTSSSDNVNPNTHNVPNNFEFARDLSTSPNSVLQPISEETMAEQVPQDFCKRLDQYIIESGVHNPYHEVNRHLKFIFEQGHRQRQQY